jgi:hypothetical protein
MSSPSLAKFTSPGEHAVVADQMPCLCGDSIIPSPALGVGINPREFECFKGLGQFVVWLGWEPQRKALSAVAVCCQSLRLPRAEGCNNCTMIQVMDQWQSERNSPKVPNVALPSHDVIWLGVMLSPCPLLLP